MAQRMLDFIGDVRRATFENEDYEDLLLVMASFNQVRIKEGYVLDGFQAGTNYSTRMVVRFSVIIYTTRAAQSALSCII